MRLFTIGESNISRQGIILYLSLIELTMPNVYLSIITISYNQGKFLQDNINSVKNYLTDGVEHIIVDPGSKDSSRLISRAYAENFPNVINIFEPDAGPAEGLNKGLNVARGEYIGILNSDDYFAVDALKNILRIIKKKNSKDIIYGYGEELKDGIGTKVHVGRLNLRNFALLQQQIFQPSIFIKKEIVQSHNIFFNINNSTCWDAEFLCSLLKVGATTKRYPIVFATFRIHKNSITGRSDNLQQYLEDIERVATLAAANRSTLFDRYFDFREKNSLYIFLKYLYIKIYDRFYAFREKRS